MFFISKTFTSTRAWGGQVPIMRAARGIWDLFPTLGSLFQAEKYTWPGSSWRPSACEADVIATRPQVPLQSVQRGNVIKKQPDSCGRTLEGQT